MIKLENISKTYSNGVNALYDISLDIQEGEFVYIIGPTGCGKSTLIKLLDGEEIPSKGKVIVNGINVGKLRHSKVPKYRRNIGVVFQDYRLLEQKKVQENIAFAMECVGASNQKIRKRTREVLALVDLSEKARSFPTELSGGQQQRVAIARAIANFPKVLVADEPTGNLDVGKANEIIQLLNKINIEERTTVLVVTHDMNLVKSYPHRTLVLDSGHLVADMPGGLNYVQ
jgi:cell division transport system ATP-binding protein